MYKAYGKLINVKIDTQSIAYPITFKPHILLDKIIPFLDISLHPRHFLIVEIFNSKVCVQS